jgi:hypothetical protein
MITRTSIVSALAIALMLTVTTGTVHASGVSKGGHPIKPKRNPIVNTIHPILHHPPLHGEGSSHNPIVASGRNCNDPNTVCRRP